jgi:hypothetical protein
MSRPVATFGSRSHSGVAASSGSSENASRRKPKRKMFAASVAGCLALAALASAAEANQTITVRFLDFRSAKPIAKVNVEITLWNGHSSDASLATKTIISRRSGKTNLDGTITICVPEPVPQHLSVFAPDLAEVSTPNLSPVEVFESGAVVPYPQNRGGSRVKIMPKPGEIVILNKRLTAWDRIRGEIP